MQLAALRVRRKQERSLPLVHLFALMRPRRVRFFALFLAVLRTERLRSVLRGFLTGRYMGARDLGRKASASKSLASPCAIPAQLRALTRTY